MKNINSKSKVLFTSIIMLVVAVMALSTATYAWFTTSTKSSVTDINMTAASAGGVRFSISNTSPVWKNTLTGAEFNFSAPSAGFAPVSTTASASPVFYKADNFQEAVGGNKIDLVADTANYIELTFYVQLDGSQLSGDASTRATAFYLFTGSQVLVKTASDAEDTALTKCIRIAFVYGGHSATANGTYSNGVTTPVLWSPASEDTSYDAIAAAATGVVLDNNNHIAQNTYVPAAGETPASGYTTSVTPTIAGAPTSSTAAIATFANDGASTNNAAAFHKFTVYIWIEGQDSACTNAAAAGQIVAAFVLSTKAIDA